MDASCSVLLLTNVYFSLGWYVHVCDGLLVLMYFFPIDKVNIYNNSAIVLPHALIAPPHESCHHFAAVTLEPGFPSLRRAFPARGGGRASCMAGSSSSPSPLDTQAGPGYHTGDSLSLAGGVRGHPRTLPPTAHAWGPARAT